MEAPIDRATTIGTGRVVPPWIRPDGATPIDRYYGFRHRDSSQSQTGTIPAAWRAFGLDRFGPEIEIDGDAPPYGGSHQLVTGAQGIVAEGFPAERLPHASVAIDVVTPRDEAGEPLFAPAWQYACFA